LSHFQIFQIYLPHPVLFNVYYFRDRAALDGDKFACMDKIRQYTLEITAVKNLNQFSQLPGILLRGTLLTHVQRFWASTVKMLFSC
jgi:hypothetical protein